MSIEINIPDIGENEFEVTEIMVKVGDKVDINESLITVEGEKTSIEIPSPQAGVVREIKITVGDKVATGKLIMIFDVEKKITEVNNKEISDLNQDKIDNKDKDLNYKKSELKEVILPNIDNDEAKVIDIMVNIGDKIIVEQPLISIENKKALIEVLSLFIGEIKEIKVKKNDKVKTGSVIMIFNVNSTVSSLTNDNKIITKSCYFSSEKHKISSTIKVNNFFKKKNEFIEIEAHVHATPLIRRLAHEFGVNLSKINGTGRKGRIMREDVQIYIKEAIKRSELESTNINYFLDMLLHRKKINFSKFGEVEKIKLCRIQKIFNANISRNWITIPHVTLMEDVDITDLEVFRKKQNKEMEKLQTGIKITPLVFVMKAVARALEEMIYFNSSISEDNQQLTLKKYIHIGIAVDTQNGLFVPVIRDVNKKGIIELSEKLMEVSKKAREGKLTISDMQGGSFTISSLGNIGTTNFTPIINAPEVAIIGLSRSSIKPIWNGSEFISRLILPISLSFDHRVINGADAARFVTRIAKLISDIRYLVM
ncbi:MAG: 2-oxo acid dehydrogenase subunit E2 [Arsenophonus sp. ET-YP4-MAG3]